jgi:hypothetical protein
MSGAISRHPTSDIRHLSRIIRQPGWLSPAGGVTTTARAIPGDWKSRRWLSSTASRV